MHPIVIEQIARFHSDDLAREAQRVRLAADVRGSWRQTAARVAIAAARAADPTAVEQLPTQPAMAPARAH